MKMTKMIASTILLVALAFCGLYAESSTVADTVLEMKINGKMDYRLLFKRESSDGEFTLMTPKTYQTYVQSINCHQATFVFKLEPFLPNNPLTQHTRLWNMLFPKRLKEKLPFSSSCYRELIRDGVNFLSFDYDTGIEENPIGIAYSSKFDNYSDSESLSFTIFKDSDGDMLPDTEELALNGAWPGLYDTDLDGLSDGQEARLSQSAPMLYDTDGDGLSDKEDPNPLKPCFMESYSLWTAHWQAVLARIGKLDKKWAKLDASTLSNGKLDFDNDGYDNLTEFQNGTSPIWGPGTPTILFSEKELVRSMNGESEKSFEMTVCSHHSITGILCISQANIDVSFEHDKFQFLPHAILPDMPEQCFGRMFLARYGLPLKFNAVLPKAVLGDIRQENIFVLCNEGQPAEYLPVMSEPSETESGSFIKVPELVSPAYGETIRNQNLHFLWQSTFSICELNVFTETWEDIFSKRTGENELAFDMSNYPTGRYYWQVTGNPTAKKPITSQVRLFTYLSPSGDVNDSDEDGFSDNQEYLAGTAPDDSSERPLNFPDSSPFSIDAASNQFFSQPLKADGGIGQTTWSVNGQKPGWLNLSPNGVLEGVPETAGNYAVEIQASDSVGNHISRMCTINVKEAKPSQSSLGGGAIGKDIPE